MEWIDVNERKPKRNQKILCLAGNTIGYATWSDNLFRFGDFVAFRAPYYYKEMKWYWMPLPKQRKEQ